MKNIYLLFIVLLPTLSVASPKWDMPQDTITGNTSDKIKKADEERLKREGERSFSFPTYQRAEPKELPSGTIDNQYGLAEHPDKTKTKDNSFDGATDKNENPFKQTQGMWNLTKVRDEAAVERYRQKREREEQVKSDEVIIDFVIVVASTILVLAAGVFIYKIVK